jgi:hypothetical protein
MQRRGERSSSSSVGCHALEYKVVTAAGIASGANADGTSPSYCRLRYRDTVSHQAVVLPPAAGRAPLVSKTRQ